MLRLRHTRVPGFHPALVPALRGGACECGTRCRVSGSLNPRGPMLRQPFLAHARVASFPHLTLCHAAFLPRNTGTALHKRRLTRTPSLFVIFLPQHTPSDINRKAPEYPAMPTPLPPVFTISKN
jgi:hypothetical protein